jgi:hypothetical protein
MDEESCGGEAKEAHRQQKPQVKLHCVNTETVLVINDIGEDPKGPRKGPKESDSDTNVMGVFHELHAPIGFAGRVTRQGSANGDQYRLLGVVVTRHRATVTKLTELVVFQAVLLTEHLEDEVGEALAVVSHVVGVEIVDESGVRGLATERLGGRPKDAGSLGDNINLVTVVMSFLKGVYDTAPRLEAFGAGKSKGLTGDVGEFHGVILV